MRGGLRYYHGDPAGAAAYVEADRSSAEHQSLADGTGVARRFTVSAGGPVRELGSISSEAYESWVGGFDPVDRQPKGLLRNGPRSVRFVELTINGPKSWSLAAALHPDIAAAYEAAQDRAAEQIVGWLSKHATTRVGSRNAQVQVPIEQLEAVTVRHYTSRAGDPHRHLHLQISSRVFAEEKWRALHTPSVRGSLAALHGIGHVAVVSDPEFRTALAKHGYSLDERGEIVELAPYVPAFSRRAAQIEANVERYEASWLAAHPGEQPGPRLRELWDARAWADGRPDKDPGESVAELERRCVEQLTDLGYSDRDEPIELTTPAVGSLDRDEAVGEVLDRLGAARSAWSAADIRGEVDQLIARRDFMVEAAVREELAEDLTDRAITRSIPLRDLSRVLAHNRAFASRQVLDAEHDLARRLAVRGGDVGRDLDRAALAKVSSAADGDLDDRQARAVAVLGGDRSLVVLENAPAAEKRAIVAMTRDVLAEDGHTLMVVTPTSRAGRAPRGGAGKSAGSASWLVHEHGWRWDDQGTWTRLRVGDIDPMTGRQHTGPSDEAVLRAGDVLMLDHARMLDRNTALALLTIADEEQARVVIVGSRSRTAWAARGSVVDLAHRWADPEARISLHEAKPTKPRSLEQVGHDLRRAWELHAEAAKMLELRPQFAQAVSAHRQIAADRAAVEATREGWQRAQRAHAHSRDQVAAAHSEPVAEAAAMAATQKQLRTSYAEHRLIHKDLAHRRRRQDHLADPGMIARMGRQLRDSEKQFASARRQLTGLLAEPAVAAHPDPAQWIATQRDRWRAEREENRGRQRVASALVRAEPRVRAEPLVRAERRLSQQHQYDSPAPAFDRGR